MKKTILLLVLSVCSFAAFSQDDDDKTFKLGVGGGISLPTADLKENFLYGINVEGLGIYKITDNIGVFADAGLGVFKTSDTYAGDAGNVLHLLAMAGPRFSFSGFFVGAGVGYCRWNNQYSSASGLLLSPQAGYDFGSFNVLLHYSMNKDGQYNYSYFGAKFFKTF